MSVEFDMRCMILLLCVDQLVLARGKELPPINVFCVTVNFA